MSLVKSIDWSGSRINSVILKENRTQDDLGSKIFIRPQIKKGGPKEAWMLTGPRNLTRSRIRMDGMGALLPAGHGMCSAPAPSQKDFWQAAVDSDASPLFLAWPLPSLPWLLALDRSTLSACGRRRLTRSASTTVHERYC
jgi:hypothetical protein